MLVIRLEESNWRDDDRIAFQTDEPQIKKLRPGFHGVDYFLLAGNRYLKNHCLIAFRHL
jgi:hypothetical protein